MEFGVVLQNNPPAREVVRLARLAEDMGFTYGWTFDSHVLWQEPFVIFTLMLEGHQGELIIFKHAISTITTARWSSDGAGDAERRPAPAGPRPTGRKDP